MSKMLEWTEAPAKGGGIDVVETTGVFGIADDLDNGGWWLMTFGTKCATKDEAKALAQKLQDALDGQPSISEVLEQVVGALTEFKAKGEYEFEAQTAPEAFLQQEIRTLLDDLFAVVRSFMPPAQGEGGPGER